VTSQTGPLVVQIVFDIAEWVEQKLPTLLRFPSNPDSWLELHRYLKGGSKMGCRISTQFREALCRHANSNTNTTPVDGVGAARNMRAWCRTREGISRQVAPMRAPNPSSSIRRAHATKLFITYLCIRVRMRQRTYHPRMKSYWCCDQSSHVRMPRLTRIGCCLSACCCLMQAIRSRVRMCVVRACACQFVRACACVCVRVRVRARAHAMSACACARVLSCVLAHLTMFARACATLA
jgi:hypothetical protein